MHVSTKLSCAITCCRAAAQPIRQARSMGVLPSGRFDGTTTMGHDFVPFETARTGQIRPSPAFETEKLPFTGQSTYKGSFVPKVS